MSKNEFLKAKKPLLKELISLLREDYEYASILAVDSYSKKYSVSKGGLSVAEDPMFTKRGFVVRVYEDGKYGEYSFNDLTEDGVRTIADEIKKVLGGLSALARPEDKIELYEEKEESYFKEVDCVSADELRDESVLTRLKALREKSFELSDKVLDTSVRFSYRRFSKLFLSDKKDLEQNVLWACGGIVVMGKNGDEIKDYYSGISSFGGKGIWEKMENALPVTVKGMEDVLGSSPMIPGEYECVCTPEVTGMIVHEAFGHGVEEDMFVKDRALAKDFLGKYVASPLVTMHDGAAAYPECGSYFFDDEGRDATDTVVIDKGILVSGINDSLSALRLGFPVTGNGRRESFERKAYTRMTNTFFTEGDSTPEEMIKSVKYGFLLENPYSGMEDPKNWGIQLMVNVAREIKDGVLTGKVFSPIVMTGYVPDLLKSISMVGKDVELCGSGFCGKGYKEWVKVSDGGPYIKAKIRLG